MVEHALSTGSYPKIKAEILCAVRLMSILGFHLDPGVLAGVARDCIPRALAVCGVNHSDCPALQLVGQLINIFMSNKRR